MLIHIKLALGACLLCANTGYAQNVNSSPSVNTGPTAEPSDPLGSILRFKPGRQLAEYIVNDPEKLFSAVDNIADSAQNKPDQFSTKAERDQFIGNVTNTLSHLGQIPLVADCRPIYDADGQRFHLTIQLSPTQVAWKRPQIGFPGYVLRVVLHRDVRTRDTYVAQNAFGAAIEVERVDITEISIAFPYTRNHFPASATASSTSYNPTRGPADAALEFIVPMKAADARMAAPDLACLFIVSLEYPYTFRYSETISPTRESPMHFRVDGSALFGRLDQVVLFNKRTSDIYDQAARAR